MKPNRKSALTFLCAILLLTSYSFADNIKAIESILTTHKWTLVEMIQKVKDTTTNMTFFMLPCEKDNYTLYSSKGSYQIMEGDSKCNIADKDSKGEGTWRYDPSDSSILDSYEGGRKISKRILVINDDILKIQYEGEERKTYTQTYFSESGKNNESNKDLAMDNSDPSQNVLQLIKAYLVSTNRYVLVGAKEFEKGIKPTADDKNQALQTVALIPFNNSKGLTNTNSLTDKAKSDLIEQAKKSGTRYVITGNLIDASALKGKDKKYYGSVKYEVNVLDATNGMKISKTFERKDSDKDVGLIIKTWVMAATIGTVMLFNNGYNAWYNYYFLSNAYRTSAEVGAVFSDVNSTMRQDNYDSAKALISVITKTTHKLYEFVGEKTPHKIKINRIDGSGKNVEMYIEAGSNINLKENEKLIVVKVIKIGEVTDYKDLGEITVKKIIADGVSSCNIKEGKKDIQEEFAKNPNDLLVLTTGKIPKD